MGQKMAKRQKYSDSFFLTQSGTFIRSYNCNSITRGRNTKTSIVRRIYCTRM